MNYERQINNLKGYEKKCEELENKISLLATEIDRINEVNRLKLKEIEDVFKIIYIYILLEVYYINFLINY